MTERRQIGIRQLKNQASRIVEEVRERDEAYVVTKRGKPVAVLSPWSSEDDRTHRARDVLASLGDLAQRVARAAGKRSAVAAVSDQRR